MSKLTLIAAWVGPGARRVKQHDVFILASTRRAYEGILDVALAELPLTCALFTLRGIAHHRDMTVR